MLRCCAFRFDRQIGRIDRDGNGAVANHHGFGAFANSIGRKPIADADQFDRHRPQRSRFVVRLARQQRARDAIETGVDVDVPHGSRRAFNLGNRPQPDDLIFVESVSDELRGGDDVARARNGRCQG